MPERQKLFIGTSGWNYDDWKGLFYPSDLKSKEYLAFYAHHFQTTEINYSFYHLPRPTTYQNWAAQVPESFVFAVKASRTITHIRRLSDVEESWRQFLENAVVLEKRLGPVLLQFPPSFRLNAQLLDRFLAESNKLKESEGIQLALEFRHPGWFDDATYRLLKKCGAALVIAHSQRYPQAPFVATAPFVYLRFHGPGQLFASSYSAAELQEWAGRIRSWMAEGLTVYAYFNNDFHGYAIDNTRALARLVRSGAR